MTLDRKELIAYKKTLSLTEIQREVLVGTLLGDATIPAQKGNASHNVKLEQKASKKEYIDHLFGTPPVNRNITGGGAQDRQSVWFRTYRYVIFTEYRNMFYKVGQSDELTLRKRVPLNIGDYLTGRSLAYWFMDDGNKNTDRKTYTISTYSFGYNEHLLLRDIFYKKVNIKVSIHRDGEHFRLYVPSEVQKDLRIWCFLIW